MKSKTIVSSAAVVLAATIVSKVIGFLESAVVAAYFGTSSELDMFFLANSIANRFVFTIFSGLSVAGVTLYNDAVKDGDCGKGNRFVSALFCCIMPMAIGAGIIIVLAAPVISEFMAANYSYQNQLTLTCYLRLLSVIAIFYSSMTMFSAILSANKIFLPGAIVGAIQNIVLIIFIVFVSDTLGVAAIVIGFVVSYFVQSVFLYICLKSVIKFEKFSFKNDINIKRLFTIIFPLILGEATGEINVLVDQFLASTQGEGYISALSFSESLNDVVTAVFIQTVTSVLLAFFAEMAIQKKFQEMIRELKKIIKIMTLILIPISVVTVTCASELISFVFKRGSFDSTSVRITANALVGYGLGFVFKTIMVIAKRPYFAVENTRVPMVVGMLTVAINISLSFFLCKVWGIFGITVATSISYLMAALILIFIMGRYIPNVSWKDCTPFFAKIGGVTVVLSVMVFVINSYVKCSVFWHLVVMTIICFGAYVFLILLMRVEEFNDLKKKMVKMIKRR